MKGKKKKKKRNLIGSTNVEVGVSNRKQQYFIEPVGFSPLMAPGHLSVWHSSKRTGNEGGRVST